MGLPLLTFEDDFISSMCGMSAEGVEQRWVDAFEDGRRVLEQAVQAKLRSNPATKAWASQTSVRLQGGSFVVVPPKAHEEELMGMELGDGSQRPQALLRGGLVRGLGSAANAITQGLDLT